MNRRRFLESMSAASVAGLLSACGGGKETDEHRFANQPMPTQDLGGVGTTPTPSAPRPTSTSPAKISPETLFQTKGMATRLAAADQAAVWSIGLNGDAKRIADVPNGAAVEVAAVADGGKIAVLTAMPTGEESVALLDGDGKPLRKISSPQPSGGIRAKPTAPLGRIAWNPNEDRLLYARGAGGIDAVSVSDGATVLVTPKLAPIPGAVVWSPAGDAVAFVSRAKSSASDGLYVGSTSSLPIDAAELVAPAKSQQRAIPTLAWLADGSRLLYAQRTQSASDALAGDLFEVFASGGGATLFISSGFAAPVSAIGRFAVSPRNEAIAFTVLAPNNNAIVFQGLWIKQFNGDTIARLDVPATSSVTGLWWTKQGLAWREQPNSLDPFNLAGEFELRRLTPAGKSELFFESKTHAATPVASPVAASPVASPIASPVASPKTTP